MRLASSLKNIKSDENARINYELGLVLSESGDAASAIKVFKFSLEVNFSISCMYELGYAYAKIGALDEAEKAFREVTLRSKEKADEYTTMLAYRQIFVICRHDGRLKDGISALKKAIKLAKKLGEKDRLDQYIDDLSEFDS